MIRTIIATLFIIIALNSCKSKYPSQFEPTLKLLEGEWTEAPGIGYREVWKQSRDGLKGAGYFHAGDSFEQSEELFIRVTDTSLVYHALVPDQNEAEIIAFPLASYSDTSLVFMNSQHDFPNVIAYYFSNDTSVHIEVRSLKDPEEGFFFDLKKAGN